MAEPTPEFLAQIQAVEDRQRAAAAAQGREQEHVAESTALANDIVAAMSPETRAKYEAARNRAK